MYLAEQLSAKSLPSLLGRIKKFGASVDTVLSDSDEAPAELALAALTCQHLIRARMFSMTSHAVPMLSAFTGLSECELRCPADLKPLGALPSLCCLVLESDALLCLTSLTVGHAKVHASGGCRFAHSLKQLRSLSSTINLGTTSMSAFTALKTLVSHSSRLKCAEQHEVLMSYLDYLPVDGLPTDILALTQLTRLDYIIDPVYLQQHSGSSIHLDWVGALLSLQEFRFTSYTDAQVHLGRHVGALSQLKVLCVRVSSSFNKLLNSNYVLRLDVPWKRLHALESLVLSGDASFGSEILALTSLRSLRSLEMCAPADTSSGSFLGAFMHILVLQQPTFTFQFDYKSTQVFEKLKAALN